MIQDDEIRCYQEGGIGWIRFNRPEARNAMTWHMYETMHQACRQFDEDEEVRLIAFRGEGGEAFVAGTDIKQFAEFNGPEDGIDYERRIDRMIGGLEQLATPTVALLDGYCIGGGAAIALACDFRYANESLKFGIPIARTLGNCMSITNVSRLVDLIGIPRTKRVLMLAQTIEAEEASSIGLIDAVVENGALDEAAERLAGKLSGHAPLTMRAAKTCINRILEERRPAHDAADDLIALCYTSDDFRGAVRRFVDKTPYTWQGR
ncbi:MAG: enoyl-CoA hydratase [Salinicola sp.]|uniref:enoyl-CoA hydratase/isomerase family protein n=1 Tax=uncultured Salinicola sp. TaxID=1193542 RepID=UPI000C96D88E|nr:enoyl-CoA hydratase/isomerase family protein [uncultured Salinicola sp.]MAM58462.1 enoyl-CoA hydratase [Salinicola sp.]